MLDTTDLSQPIRQRSPAFTLGTALVWLGHDCPGDCPPDVSARPAEVWFVRANGTASHTWALTIVDVDFTASPQDSRQDLLEQVNDCVRPDRIRVRHRSTPERSRPTALNMQPTCADPS